jgi:hypothetical protein
MVQLEIEPDQANVIINHEILTAALQNLRNDFVRQILKANLSNLLIQVYNTGDFGDSNTEDFVKLLHSLMVLEYINGDLWYDVHPLVADWLKQKKLIS